MKSIKPGRGPSAMGGVASAIAVLFGIFWTIAAIRIQAPVIMPLFGVLFVIMGIVQAVYHFKNATGKNRYSAFDITDGREEPDPLQDMFSGERLEDVDAASRSAGTNASGGETAFCPYCGARAQEDFSFCRTCGKQLPH